MDIQDHVGGAVPDDRVGIGGHVIQKFLDALEGAFSGVACSTTVALRACKIVR